MIYVFCDTADLPALWAAGRLRARGLTVEIVSAQVLEAALTWRHRVSADGVAGVTIELADGRRISSEAAAAVLNRVSHVPRSRVDRVGGEDRDYAVQEMNALFLSWLEALPGLVVNPATPQGLCGRWRHPSEWALLAAKAGLASAPYRQSDETDPDRACLMAPVPGAVSVFAVGEAAVGPPQVPTGVREACVRLARAAGEVLLGVDLLPGVDGVWRLAGASPTPDLMRGGEPLIDALAALLEPAAREEALAS
jgi:hypothetical protein